MELVYYIWVRDSKTTATDPWDGWRVEGVYSSLEHAESHKTAILMGGETGKVEIVPGPLKIE